MSITEAPRGYPVRLRAVVTYYDPYVDPRHVALFIADSTGSVFVALSAAPAVPLTAGELVEILGQAHPGTSLRSLVTPRFM